MSDRHATHRQARPTLRSPESRHARGLRLLPLVEGLEGRALLSYGGSPDFTFGTQGYLANPVPAGTSGFRVVAEVVQPDGKILEAGSVTGPLLNNGNTSNAFAVARLNVDGTPDSSFGVGGFFTSPALTSTLSFSNFVGSSADGLALESDGSIVAVGNHGSQAVVARIAPAGTLDTTFGTAGVTTLGTPGTSDGQVDLAIAAAVLPGGLIAIGGLVEPSPTVEIPAVERLNVDGSVAVAFGDHGVVQSPRRSARRSPTRSATTRTPRSPASWGSPTARSSSPPTRSSTVAAAGSSARARSS